MVRAVCSPAEALVQERLAQAGRLTFAEFMDLALYAPGAGYYTTQAVFGESGDYITSPEIHPAFGALLGRQLEVCWQALGRPARFQAREIGAGRGLLCRDILLWARAAAPEFAESLVYEIVERSPLLRSRQAETLARAGLEGAAVRWLATDAPEPALTPEPLVGCAFSNEFIDSLPVHLVTMRQGRLREYYVMAGPEGLTLAEDDPSTPALAAYFERLGLWPGEGCRAEVNLRAVDWVAALAAQVQRGLVLTIDYGYPAPMLYTPTRRSGTLLCYYRHTLSSDPLQRVGRQEITSHVDFTTLAQTGERHGLRLLGLLSQARFLANLGLTAYAERLAGLPSPERETNQRALQALVDPTGLGRIGVLLQQRGLDGYLPRGLLPPVSSPSTAYLPRLGAEALRLPAPEQLDGLGDFTQLWRAFVTGDESALDGPFVHCLSFDQEGGEREE